MDAAQRFINARTISLFIDLLRSERDPVGQAVLEKLLVEEEQRFGEAVERLEMVEQHIAVGERLIKRQVDTIVMLKANGQDVSEAQVTLENFRSLQLLFLKYRETLTERWDPTG
jgi:hypothetical protein